MSPDNTVSKATGWTTKVQFLVGALRIFYSPPCPEELWNPPSIVGFKLLQAGWQGFYSRQGQC